MRRALTAAIAIAAFAVTAQSAGAADMPIRSPVVKGPVVAPAPVYNWTGWYAGVHLGYGWGDKSWTEPGVPFSVDYGVDGFLAGGQLGFNIQNGPWVWGIEGDISWTNIDGSVFAAFCALGTCATDVSWLGTLTGRVGYASGPGLFYVKGGGAWADEDHSARGAGIFTASETRSGWTLGVGYEYDFGNNWSAKLEYSYIDFGKERVTFAQSTEALDIDQDMHVVKWGLNYRFATGKAPILGKTPPPAPVVTKY
jgi:outer membrane immunogenic protein